MKILNQYIVLDEYDNVQILYECKDQWYITRTAMGLKLITEDKAKELIKKTP